MNRKFIFIISILLIIPLISSCSLFGEDESFSCNDLVVTGEDSPEAIEYRGDPSDQWVISGIKTDYDTESEIESQGQDVFTVTFEVNPAYPNPAYPNPTNQSTNLNFELPKTMSVKIRVKSSSDDYNNIIVDNRFYEGRHQIKVDLSESSSECFRADFYFDGSKKSNAYGLIKVESAESR